MIRFLPLTTAMLFLMFFMPQAYSQLLKSDSTNVTHYNINLDVVFLSKKSILGFTDVTFTPASTKLQTLQLDLLKMSIDSIRYNGVSLGSGMNYNDTILKISLPSILTQGDTSTVRIYYHGQPQIESGNWGGFHFLSDSTLAFNLAVAFVDSPHTYGRIWFPCIDEFTDKATYDFHIRTKSDKIAVCSGTLVSVLNESGGTRLHHWKLQQAIPTYLAGIAISNYAVVSDTFNGLLGNIPLDIYIRPADTAKARLSFVHLKNMMQIFENRFGPYRWPRVGYVITTLGAMEHVMNIALPTHTVTGSTSNEWLYAHELSHHWFGNLVTCETAGDMWLNEGWAVFSEQIFTEGLYGWQAYKDYARENHESILSKLHTSAGDGSYMAVYGIPHNYTYGKTVYDKGGSMAHCLRGFLGDNLFFPALKAYMDSFSFKSANTFQFRDFLSNHSGINLTPWFDAWIFSPGFLHYSIDSVKISPQGTNFNVQVWIKQKRKGPAQFCLHNRIEVYFMDASWNLHSRMIDYSGIDGSQTFSLNFNPLAVLLNAEEKILDASTSQYKRIKQAGLIDFTTEKFRLDVVQANDSGFVRVTHNWVAPDALKTFVPRLILSDNRYWTIEGYFPAGFSAKGRFSYGKLNYLDPILLADNKDSLVILYRSNPAQDWQGIPFTKSGSSVAGYLIVDNLQPGQYTLAVWDDNPLGLSELASQKSLKHLEIFPNPAAEVLSFKADFPASFYRISDTAGTIRMSGVINQNSEEQTITISSLPTGLYYLRLFSDKGAVISGAKFIKSIQ